MTSDEIRELARRAEQRPPLFSPCRWGFHRQVQVLRFITTGRAVCPDCGKAWMTSLFGDFDVSRAEGAAWMRAAADKIDAQGIDARSGGTVKQGPARRAKARPEGMRHE